MVYEMAYAHVFKKRDAPAIGMMVRVPPALGKPAEGKGDVRGRIGIHAEQLAHGKLNVEKGRSAREVEGPPEGRRHI